MRDAVFKLEDTWQYTAKQLLREANIACSNDVHIATIQRVILSMEERVVQQKNI